MCVDLNNRYCNERTGICGNGQSFRSESSGRYDFKAKLYKNPRIICNTKINSVEECRDRLNYVGWEGGTNRLGVHGLM